MTKVLVFLVIFTNLAFAKKTSDRVFDLVFRNKLYYSSYVYLKKAIKEKRSLSPKKVQIVLDQIHPSIFIHDSELDQFTGRSTYLNYPVALRRFFQNDREGALRKLNQVGKRNVFFVERNYVQALIYLTQGKASAAKKHFRLCIKYSSKRRRHELKEESYIESFRNRCVQQIARLEFSHRNYKKSLRYLNYVKKTDYIWPRLLLDKAWNYYWNKEKPRALGTVISFKAPLLQRFMVPEANYIRALIYYEMCYFKKAEKIYSEFNQNTWKYRKYLLKVNKEKMYKLILSRKEPRSNAEKFLYYYFKGFKKDIKYLSFLKAKRSLVAEIKKLKKVRQLKQAKIFLKELYAYNKIMKKDFLDFLKTITIDYYYQIRNARKFFAKLSLMVSLKQRRNLLRKEVSEESRELDLDKIPNTDEKFIWDFRGGFWADELGDYAVAVKNRCQK